MKDLIMKRLAQMAVVFVIVSMFAFSIIYFSPGDPLYLYTSPSVSTYKMSEEQLDDMRASLGLEGNVVQRYIDWAGKMLKGDWGLSISNHQPVKKQILDRLPNTIGLMGAALVLSVLLAIPLGLLAGYWDHADHCFFIKAGLAAQRGHAYHRGRVCPGRDPAWDLACDRTEREQYRCVCPVHPFQHH